jgi:hypothetical protein
MLTVWKRAFSLGAPPYGGVLYLPKTGAVLIRDSAALFKRMELFNRMFAR